MYPNILGHLNNRNALRVLNFVLPKHDLKVLASSISECEHNLKYNFNYTIYLYYIVYINFTYLYKIIILFIYYFN